MSHSVSLTATEISNIWSAYLKSSMEFRFFEYFLKTTEDKEIKTILDKMINYSKQSIHGLKEFFIKENLSIPLGFTEEDVHIGTNKVFSDTFVLYFCYDLTLLSMTTYPSAFSDCTRKDIRDFFQLGIEQSIMIQNEIVDTMLSKGVYLKSPQIEIDNDVDLVGTVRYVNGLFGGSRPLNTPEIANLTRVIHRAQFSKMIFVTFHKLATSKELKKFFTKGRNEIEKVLNSLQEVLNEENIPISSSSDYTNYDTDVAPFSDKLMLFFVNTCIGMFCFIMINQAMTSSLRSDLVYKFSNISDDMRKYYGEGLLLTIKEKWLEQPPQAMDRKI